MVTKQRNSTLILLLVNESLFHSPGDTAHTLSYCPWTKETSVAKAIKQQAGRNSMGIKKK